MLEFYVKDSDPKINKCYKWIVLISFCLNSFSNVFSYGAQLPSWTQVAAYYNTTDYNLNWSYNSALFSSMTFSFIFNPLILKNFGLSQVLSCVLTAVGYWLQYYFGQNYSLALIAFAFLGVGQAAFYQVPLYLSKLWFDTQERVTSTFIGQYINYLGLFLGYAYASFYLTGIVDQEEFNSQFENMIKINAIFSSVIIVINFTTLKQHNSIQRKIEIRYSIWGSTYKIFTTSEGALDLLSVSYILGWSQIYPTLFSIQQYDLGQTYMDVNEVSLTFYSGQILAASICTWQLQKQSNSGFQQDYDKYIKYTTVIGFVFLVIELLFFELMSVEVLAIINVFVGGGLGGLYSVFLESLMEKHYPIQELSIGAILFAVSNAEYFIISMIMVIPQFSNIGFFVSCIMMIPPVCYIVVFYQTQFKRFESEG